MVIIVIIIIIISSSSSSSSSTSISIVIIIITAEAVLTEAHLLLVLRGNQRPDITVWLVTSSASEESASDAAKE